VSLGACVIEKHFTLSRKRVTPDSFFSIEPAELKKLVDDTRTAEAALGKVHYGLTSEEKNNRIFRRSLFVVKDIEKGERFTLENVRAIRPAYGLKPKYLKNILGKKALVDIKRGTPLLERMVGKYAMW
jgi:sialic acid synthase SpsE